MLHGLRQGQYAGISCIFAGRTDPMFFSCKEARVRLEFKYLKGADRVIFR
jgi:hypothetical protein